MKGGTGPLMAVYKYAEPITTKGFVFMDTPGFDPVSATGQIAGGDNRIVGVMIESNLVGGRQDLVPGEPLTYGQSITDGCIDWDNTVGVLKDLAEAVETRRQR